MSQSGAATAQWLFEDTAEGEYQRQSLRKEKQRLAEEKRKLEKEKRKISQLGLQPYHSYFSYVFKYE